MARFLLALLLITTAVRADPQFGSPREVAPPDLVPAWGQQSFPAAAAGGGMALVVWIDGRQSDPTASWLLQQPSLLMGARIDQDGTILDPTGFVIASGNPWFAGVTWIGERFLVVWYDFTALEWKYAEITPEGSVIPGGTVIGTGVVPYRAGPGIASRGDGTSLVAMQGSTQLGHLSGSLLLIRDGMVLGGSAIPPPALRPGTPSIVIDENGYRAYFFGDYEMGSHHIDEVAVDVDAGNAVRRALPIPGFGTGSIASRRFSNGGTHLYWFDSGLFSIQHAFLTLGGPLQDIGPIVLPEGDLPVVFPFAAQSGERTLLTFSRSVGRIFCFPDCDPNVYEPHALELGPDGLPSGPEWTLGPGQSGPPVASRLGPGFLAAWHAAPPTSPFTSLAYVPGDVFGSIIDQEPGERFVISRSAAAHTEAAIGSRDDAALVAWLEHRDGTYSGEVRARPFDRFGVPRIAVPLVLDSVGPDFTDLEIASGDGTYLVAWQETRDGDATNIEGAILSSSNFSIVPIAPIPLAPGSQCDSCDRMAIEDTGVGYLIAWTDAAGIHTRLLDAQGEPRGADRTLPLPAGGRHELELVRGEGNALLVWRDSGVSIAGAVFSPEGEGGPPFTIVAEPIYGFSSLAAAFDGNVWVVSYRSESQIHANRISFSGTILDGAAGVLLLESAAQAPELALVAGDGRAALIYDVLTADGSRRLGLAQFDTTGPPTVDVPLVTLDGVRPADLTRFGDGALLLATRERIDSPAHGGVDRIVLRSFGENPEPAPIPTMGWWMLTLLAIGVAATALIRIG